MQDRWEYALQRFEEGISAYQVQKECREKFGVGIGYETLLKLKAGKAVKEKPAPAGGSLIKSLDLPPEVLQPSSPSIPATGDAGHTIRSLHSWMQKVGAEEFSIKADGGVEVLIRHHLNLKDLP